MIDTIVLTIPRENFTTISNPKAANWELNSKSGNYEKYVKNQTYKQKNDGVYRLRVRVIKRGLSSSLQIEFSIPKLLFSNNVDEVSEKDFENILQILQIRLRDFGIYIFTHQLKAASVSAFHPSKNILLSEGYTASGVIKELRKINLTKRMDLHRDSFRNDGQSLQFYTNSHSLVIYDKMQDLRKPKKRAIDKDQTPTQFTPFHELDQANAKTEILRLEVRITKKIKINGLLSKLGYQKNPTFEDIFKEKLCQDIVSQYWNELVINQSLFLFDLATNPKQILKRLLRNFPEMKPREIIYLVGLHQLSRDNDGIRELRGYIEKQSSQRTWYRTAKDMEKLNIGQKQDYCHAWLKQVDSQLKTFTPLKIHHLLCKEL